jgi:limonene-1,2-epoxide hydrolase
MGEQENAAAVDRYWSALSRQDFEAAVEELHDGFEETYVQSGERIVGKENRLGLLRAHAGFPAISVVRTVGRSDLWVTEAEFDYARDGSPPWQVCEVQELRNGRIARIHAFFGSPFEAAEWRGPFVERAPAGG